MKNCLYIGIKSHVVCIDKRDGSERWRRKIKTGEIVNLVRDGDLIFAYSGGHLLCLSAVDGAFLWRNKLPGLGYGYCLFSDNGNEGAVTYAAEMETQDHD